MKKCIIALSTVLCLLLTACGDTRAQQFTTDDVETILNAGVFSEELEEVDAEMVCALYGVDEGIVAGCTAYLSTGATAEEVVLFLLNDAKDTESVQEACEKRLSDQIEAYEGYGPEQVPKLENAVLEVRETTVLLVVADNAQEAAAIVAGMK